MKNFKNRYLSLIDCEEQAELAPSVAGLNSIMESHLYHIHFNGFSFLTMNSNNVNLDPYIFLENTLRDNQGGICFELNCALNELLKKLGYTTHLVETMMDHIKDRSVPQYDIATHNAIIVELEGENYLVDVGLGNYFRKPISFSREHQDASGRYKIIQYDVSKKIFQLKRLNTKSNQWVSQYRFSCINKKPNDFRANIEKVCDKSCHLTKDFFMIKPYSANSYKVIDGGREIGLTWIHSTPEKNEKIKMDANLARQKLTEEFQMKAEQIEIILSECKVPESSQKGQIRDALNSLKDIFRKVSMSLKNIYTITWR
ncbi:MAG: hypothetical protein D3913_00005 [Candidatus Electrothrix sp. LOE1_4_5]|nr:hypothetical protein [Candidatus Electrothrix gigas]